MTPKSPIGSVIFASEIGQLLPFAILATEPSSAIQPDTVALAASIEPMLNGQGCDAAHDTAAQG
jgi:hypothetical protein